MNQIIKKILIFIIVVFSFNTYAERNADDVAKLGNELTPLGGIKAANAGGTIQVWDGGLLEPPTDY